MDNFFYEKKVDWSLLKDGFSLPLTTHALLRNKTGFPLEIGEKHTINIVINGISFNAVLTNVDFDRKKYPNNKEIIQIRYSPNSDISQYFRKIFAISYQTISAQKNFSSKQRINNTETPEFLRLYTTDKPDTFIGQAVAWNDNSKSIKESKYNISQDSIQTGCVLSDGGDLTKIKYLLIAYALKGAMTVSEVVDYLHNTIEPIVGYADKKIPIIAQYMVYVTNNMKTNKSGRFHYGNWYAKTNSDKYCLDCPQDLQSRIYYAQNTEYCKYKSKVFRESEFEEIIQEFINKDSSLDENKILEYCKNKTVAELNENDWYPADYNPGFSIKEWGDLINYPEIFNTISLEVVKRLLYSGEAGATCTQLAHEYGETVNFYKNASTALAERIVNATNCPVQKREDGSTRWWTVLYLGKSASKEDAGSYLWKLRPELAEALKQVDLSAVKLYADDKQISDNTCSDNVNYWWLNANPKMWSMSAAPVGEVQDYTLYNDNQHKRRVFQNFLDAKVSDMIIGYESTPVKQIVALFQISQEQDGERIYFKKIEHLAVPIDLATLQTQPELAEMEFFKNSQASLLKLSPAEYDCIINLIRDVNPLPQVRKIEEYGAEKFLSEVFMNREKYDSLVHILQAKKNIILQGAPGVGKTFAARRLAYSIMGVKDDSRIEFVQFHQNYSYEDFVMGYKPNDNGFELKKGIFYSFCQKAVSEPEKDYFFIIDEINRGNMSKIFGELLMLIEKDYRGTSLTLAYDGLPFRVPKNLHIIGMMNTADRSLAMIDYALRRRFSFFDMEPGFESDGFKAYLSGLNSEKLDKLVDEIKSLNNAIAEDKSLGKGFCIGHSYLCGAETYSKEWLQGVVEYDILPMLAEYWFDELDKYEEWKKRLTEIVK